MLFCPFCGEPIVIPEQDAERPEAPEPVETSIPISEANADETKTEPRTNIEDTAEALERSDDVTEVNHRNGAAEELLDWNVERENMAADTWARPQDTEEPFTPLNIEPAPEQGVDWQEEIKRKKASVAPEKKPPSMQRSDEAPIRLEGRAPKLDQGSERAGGKTEDRPSRVAPAQPVKREKVAAHSKGVHRPSNTLVPPKTMDANELFMDSTGGDFDDYDAYDSDSLQDEGVFAFDDEDEGSFFMRHLRSIVGLSMFMILLLLFVIYAFSRSGQLTLAKANLAWSTEAYSTLGYQSYQQGQYAQAGTYYERALQRSSDNYSYASSAAMAYYEAGNIEKAAEMLKICTQIQPSALEPYMYLLKLYPDAASRPWDITQLLQQGYRQTGDGRLNVTG